MEKLSCFVLISNHPNLSAKEILNEYRNQSVVENRFKFINDPIYIGSLHIKRKERLEALCYVALIALALYMILQIRVRNALKNESEPVMLAGKKKSFEPTANKILELFAPIKVMWLRDGKSIERQLPKRYRQLKRVLNMAGFDCVRKAILAGFGNIADIVFKELGVFLFNFIPGDKLSHPGPAVICPEFTFKSQSING